MPEPNLQPDNEIRWSSEPDDNGAQPDSVLRDWLTHAGLLTARLRRQCGKDFRLEVIEDSTRQRNDGRHDEIRRIVLWCGDQACVYAETLLPETTIEKLPWLRELGNEPLGESLQRRLNIRRGEFEYALIAAAQLPLEFPAQTEAALWARRSEFYADNTSLLVTEIFLPAVTKCISQRA